MNPRPAGSAKRSGAHSQRNNLSLRCLINLFRFCPAATINPSIFTFGNLRNRKRVKQWYCLASPAGRITRILAGIALIAWGLFGLGGATGIVVAVIGALPLLAGLFKVCLFAPLFGAPISGPKIRAGK